MNIGRDEVNMPSWPRGDPCLHFGVLVGGVIIDDHVNVQLLRNRSIDLSEERKEWT